MTSVVQLGTLWALIVAGGLTIRWRDRRLGYRPDRRDW